MAHQRPGRDQSRDGHRGCRTWIQPPLIAITGQVNQNMIGRRRVPGNRYHRGHVAHREAQYLITDVNDIPRIVKEAFYIAQSGRPGPVVIDFPKNIQQAKTQPVWPTLEQVKKGLRGYNHRPICARTISR